MCQGVGRTSTTEPLYHEKLIFSLTMVFRKNAETDNYLSECCVESHVRNVNASVTL